jgi:hypothetical protein
MSAVINSSADTIACTDTVQHHHCCTVWHMGLVTNWEITENFERKYYLPIAVQKNTLS